ncbi:MAG: glycosyltransferase family 39 protein, partial [Burkholderiales bacterium]|nr:glycosyltransferase family 39 protein [Anaerolineae bacterium]
MGIPAAVAGDRGDDCAGGGLAVSDGTSVGARRALPLPRSRWLLLLVIVVVIVAALPVLTFPLGRDQGEFATIGSGILDGRIPYVQLWNPKPPAVFYTYALAMAAFGHTTMALRAIDLLIVPIICAALYWLGKRIANANVGLWAALIFPTFYFSESFWTLTQNDGIAILPMVLAMVCMFKASDSDTKRGALWAFGCGLLCALTLWFKYPFALFVLALVVGYVVLMRATPSPNPFPASREGEQSPSPQAERDLGRGSRQHF